MKKSELGIDEAGRGPVLGPMVLAGVVVPQGEMSRLADWGVKDSKVFGSGARAQAKREALAHRIMASFRHKITVLSPEIIDRYVREHSLNKLEQKTARDIIASLPAETVVLDGASLFKPLVGDSVHALNKADETYLSVAAASILAKWKRDVLFDELCQPFTDSFGDIRGGGYANAKTLEFVKWHLENRGGLPFFYRKSYNWKALNQSQS